MGHAGCESSDGFHLLRLDELQLGRLQFLVGTPQRFGIGGQLGVL
jgi:hypothetical protein